MNEMHKASDPLDSRQLQALVALARTGSFTLAAKELFLSQSAISHSMKALEDAVGCRLLDRVGKKTTLTPAGEQLLFHAEKILQEMAEARERLQHLESWGISRIRLAASLSACHYLLPPVLKQLKEKFPKCAISVEPENTPGAIEKLCARQIDLALVPIPRHDPECSVEPLFSDELVFVVDRDHPWAQAGRVTRSEIQSQNYILYNQASHTFRLVQEYFRHELITLKNIVQVGSMDATKEFVKLGLGITVAAPWVVRKELAEKSLVALPLGQRKLRRTWAVMYRSGRGLNLAEEAFLGYCRTLAGSSMFASAEP